MSEPAFPRDAYWANFWSKVSRVPGQGLGTCWEWQAFKGPDGYGRHKLFNKQNRSHRLALMHKLGRFLGPKEVARHLCDNRACCRPEHLEVGSQSDNMRDAVARQRFTRGEARVNVSKLTELQVRQIRANVAAGEPQISQCAKFSVSAMTISRVINRQTWGHVK